MLLMLKVASFTGACFESSEGDGEGQAGYEGFTEGGDARASLASNGRGRPFPHFLSRFHTFCLRLLSPCDLAEVGVT